MQQRQFNYTSSARLATGLGWFSVALGCSEVMFPRQMARLIGVPDTPGTITTLQGYGAREIATGLAILSQPDRPTWLWSRVAGDALDLATLASFMGSSQSDRARTALASAVVLGVTGLDVYAARRMSGNGHRQMADVEPIAPRQPRDEAITINASADRIREIWRSRHQLPEALTAYDPTGEDGLIRMRPAPGSRGTEVRVRLSHAGAPGVLDRAAGLVGHDEATRLREALRTLKQVVETGEPVRSEGPSLWRAAQPMAAATARIQGERR
jgi:uncharacterized membrane protein